MRKSLLLVFGAAIFAVNFSNAQTITPKGAKMSMKTSTKEIAVIETSMGVFEFELYRNDAPKTVDNFVRLAGKKYFDGMRFHRVSRGFVVQTGDPHSKDLTKVSLWGTGGKSIYEKEFEDELNPSTPSAKEGYRRGVVAMANHGPNTNSSQFFICLKDVGLPHRYTIFGKIIKGMDIVEAIGRVEIVPLMGPTDGRPQKEVMMKKVSVKKETGK